MGIHNRDDQHKPSGGSMHRSMPRRSVVTNIILVTAGLFCLQLFTKDNFGGSLLSDWLAIERDLVLRSGQIWRLLTYAFCHSETQMTHIVCNMVALFFLGRIVAQTLGQREFLAVYLTAAVFAGIVQVCTMAAFRTSGPAWVLGASGAISAVFMLFAMYYPRVKLYLFGVVPVEARWLLAGVVTFDALGFFGLVPDIFLPEGAKIGHACHLGGLIFGLLYFRWDMNLTRWWDRFAGRLRTAELPRQNIRIYNPEAQPEVDYADHVDRILAKISREGEASLTPRERRILTQASAHMKSQR